MPHGPVANPTKLKTKRDNYKYNAFPAFNHPKKKTKMTIFNTDEGQK